GPDGHLPQRSLDHARASAHLARPEDLRSAQAALRDLRRVASLPFVARLTRTTLSTAGGVRTGHSTNHRTRERETTCRIEPTPWRCWRSGWRTRDSGSTCTRSRRLCVTTRG